jgi:hypothetical protein
MIRQKAKTDVLTFAFSPLESVVSPCCYKVGAGEGNRTLIYDQLSGVDYQQLTKL